MLSCDMAAATATERSLWLRRRSGRALRHHERFRRPPGEPCDAFVASWRAARSRRVLVTLCRPGTKSLAAVGWGWLDGKLVDAERSHRVLAAVRRQRAKISRDREGRVGDIRGRVLPPVDIQLRFCTLRTDLCVFSSVGAVLALAVDGAGPPVRAVGVRDVAARPLNGDSSLLDEGRCLGRRRHCEEREPFLVADVAGTRGLLDALGVQVRRVRDEHDPSVGPLVVERRRRAAEQGGRGAVKSCVERNLSHGGGVRQVDCAQHNDADHLDEHCRHLEGARAHANGLYRSCELLYFLKIESKQKFELKGEYFGLGTWA